MRSPASRNTPTASRPSSTSAIPGSRRRARIIPRRYSCCIAISGIANTLNHHEALPSAEKQAESTLAVPAELDALEKQIAIALADRLQARAEPNKPGYMILNPCGFARRAALELEGGAHPLPIG